MKHIINKLSSDRRLINLSEKDFDRPIYRILPMNRLIEILLNKELAFPKVNLWEVVYENFFLKAYSNEIAGFKEDIERYFGQCWSFIKDSDALWRIYSNDKQSVRIKQL
jgi:hypothetical protein